MGVGAFLLQMRWDDLLDERRDEQISSVRVRQIKQHNDNVTGMVHEMVRFIVKVWGLGYEPSPLLALLRTLRACSTPFLAISAGLASVPISKTGTPIRAPRLTS